MAEAVQQVAMEHRLQQVAMDRLQQKTKLTLEKRALGESASFLSVVKVGMEVARILADRTLMDKMTAIKNQEGFGQLYAEAQMYYIGNIKQTKVSVALMLILRRFCGVEAGKPKEMLTMYGIEEIQMVPLREASLPIHDIFMIDYDDGTDITNQGQIVVQYDTDIDNASVYYFKLNNELTLTPNLIFKDTNRNSWFRAREFQTIQKEKRVLTWADIAELSDCLASQMQGRKEFLQSLIE